MVRRRLLIALLAAPLAAQAVPGVPDPPLAGPMPAWWFAWSNDSFVRGPRARDDLRTNQVELVARPLPRLLLALDHSMLTDRGPRRARSDELTATAAVLLVDDRWRGWWQLQTLAGGGVRVADDLGGAWIQHEIHDVIGVDDFALAYDAPERAGVAIGRFAVVLRGAAWTHDLRPQVAIASAVLATDGGHVQTHSGLAFALAAPLLAMQAGVNRRDSGGAGLTPTAAIVAATEDGWWLEGRLAFRNVFGSLAYEVSECAFVGAIGWRQGIP